MKVGSTERANDRNRLNGSCRTHFWDTFFARTGADLLEHISDPSTDFCEHCGQPVIEAPKVSEPQTADLPVVKPAPLFEVRTPDGRVVYVANLN
jgi:hypothetical protein